MAFDENDKPKHVAIIMDGNNRWAKQKGLSKLEGHQAGSDNVRTVVEIFSDYGIEYLTLFAFSSENWGRPRSEVNGLLRIFSAMIDTEIKTLHQKGVRLKHLGRLSRLSNPLQKKINAAVELTNNNRGMTLIVAFDYGARNEISDAFKRLLNTGISPDGVDEEVIKENLYLPGIPDPDLIIRTGGEMRLSNFLLWQAAYSELYFTEVPWPDFDRKEIDLALANYIRRQRYFGKR